MKTIQSNISFRLLSLLAITTIALFSHPAVYADNSVMSIFHPAAVVNGTDASIQFLGFLFGSVDGVLAGYGSNMAGAMFGVFNAAVLALGGMILIYTSIVSTLSTAQDGQYMGKKWNSIWVPVRTVMGAALLIPKASGYSMIQIAIMWIVLQGVAAADFMWNTATDYIIGNGSIMPVKVGAQNVNDLVENVAVPILKQQICLAALQNYHNNYDYKGKIQQRLEGYASLYPSYPTLKNGIYYINFPGKDSLPNPNLSNMQEGSASASCGSITFPKQADNMSDQAKVSATWQAVLDLQPVAQQIVDDNGINSNNQAQIYYGIERAALDYIAIMDPVMRMKNQNLSNNLTVMLKQSQANGWILAGGYYNIFSSLNNEAKQITNDFPTANLVNPTQNGNNGISRTSWSYITTLTASIKQADMTAVENDLTSGSFNGYSANNGQTPTANTAPDINWDLPNQDFHFSGDSILDVGNWMESVVNTIIDHVINPIVNLLGNMFLNTAYAPGVQSFSQAFQNGNGDPIQAVMMMGNNMIDSLAKAWISVVITIATACGVGGILGSLFPGFMILQNILSWIVPFMTTIMTMLFTAGAILAYYVPLVPYMLFLFGGIGWMMAVIESMVAGPIVAVGILHPDGHDHYGKAEPAVMLLINIFLRPSLMIIGFIFGIMLSYVAVKLLNLGFMTAVSNLIYGNNQTLIQTGEFSTALKSIAILVMYVMLIVMIINKTFGLINDVPNKVLRWLSSGDAQLGDSSADLSQVQGAVSSGAGQFGGAAKGMADQAPGAAGEIGKNTGAQAKQVGGAAASGAKWLAGSGKEDDNPPGVAGV